MTHDGATPCALRLTIAIPTLNRASCVGRAVESALRQTSANVEILVSDNGSSDETWSILELYDDPKLRKFHHPTTINAAAHGRFLMEQATGDFFVGLSDDDWLEPEFAKRVLDLFARHPELSFVYTCWWMEVADRRIPSVPGPECENSLDFLLAFFQGRRSLAWCACACRTADLLRVGPQPTDLIIGDLFFWTKIATEGPVGCVAEPLSHYTFLTDNMTLRTTVGDWARDHRLIFAELRARLVEYPTTTVWMRRFETALTGYLGRASATQFVWLAIRGVPKQTLAKSLTEIIGLLGADWRTAVQVIAAFVLPRRLLRPLFLHRLSRHAARMVRPPNRLTSATLPTSEQP